MRNNTGRDMLLFTCAMGESLVIHECITITVLELRNSRVRLCVKAPKEISIHREEVYDRVMRGQSVCHTENTPTERARPEKDDGHPG